MEASRGGGANLDIGSAEMIVEENKRGARSLSDCQRVIEVTESACLFNEGRDLLEPGEPGGTQRSGSAADDAESSSENLGLDTSCTIRNNPYTISQSIGSKEKDYLLSSVSSIRSRRCCAILSRYSCAEENRKDDQPPCIDRGIDTHKSHEGLFGIHYVAPRLPAGVQRSPG